MGSGVSTNKNDVMLNKYHVSKASALCWLLMVHGLCGNFLAKSVTRRLVFRKPVTITTHTHTHKFHSNWQNVVLWHWWIPAPLRSVLSNRQINRQYPQRKNWNMSNFFLLSELFFDPDALVIRKLSRLTRSRLRFCKKARTRYLVFLSLSDPFDFTQVFIDSLPAPHDSIIDRI